MNRARKGAVALSVLMSAALLVGCGSDEGGGNGTDSGDNGQVEEGGTQDTDDDDGY